VYWLTGARPETVHEVIGPLNVCLVDPSIPFTHTLVCAGLTPAGTVHDTDALLM
jgi:hypothetical protein